MYQFIVFLYVLWPLYLRSYIRNKMLEIHGASCLNKVVLKNMELVHSIKIRVKIVQLLLLIYYIRKIFVNLTVFYKCCNKINSSKPEISDPILDTRV